jgi:hypothetical protein
MMDNLVSRCAIPPAAAREAKATLGSFAGYGARAWRRLPPRSAVSQLKGGKGTAATGEMGLRPIPHNAVFRQIGLSQQSSNVRF